MKYSSNILFMMIMVMSTMMTMSSFSWISMWMGLEINMIAFIPLMFKSKNSMSAESCMIYFLSQSMGSMILLFTILTEPMMKMSSTTMNMMIIVSMAVKLGMPPFHFWFVQTMSKMSWDSCLLLMTWQKLAPLFVLSNMINSKMMIMVVMSTIVGAIGGLNQTSTRKIMAFSSINHMGWMLACMMYNNNMWMMYMIMYSMLTMMVVKMMEYKSIMFINQIQMKMKTMEKMYIAMMMMSLGGLPPFMGFMPKWMVIQSMMYSESQLVLMVMMMMSLITLFYYLRMMSSMLMMNFSMNKWTMKSLKNNNMMIMSMINFTMPMLTMCFF